MPEGPPWGQVEGECFAPFSVKNVTKMGSKSVVFQLEAPLLVAKEGCEALSFLAKETQMQHLATMVQTIGV